MVENWRGSSACSAFLSATDLCHPPPPSAPTHPWCMFSGISGNNRSEKVVGLMSNLTAKAEKDNVYYSVDNTVVALGETVYRMVLCWRSLNASDCRDCLESARSNVSRCLSASDEKALNAGCFVSHDSFRTLMIRDDELRRRTGEAPMCPLRQAKIENDEEGQIFDKIAWYSLIPD